MQLKNKIWIKKKNMIKDLFGNMIPQSEENNHTEPLSLNNDKRPAKEIFMPSEEERQRLLKILSSYTLADLQDHLDPFYKFARKYRLYYIDKNGKQKCPSEIRYILSGGKKLKNNWVRFFAIMRYHRNLHYFLDEMSEPEKDLMQVVLENRIVSETEAAKILGEKCTHKVKGGYYYEHTELIPKLSLWYELKNAIGYDPDRPWSTYRGRTPHLMLQKGLHKDLLKALNPQFFIPKDIKELPHNEKLLTYNNEVAIQTIFPMLRVMYRTHQIEFGSNKCTATTVKKVAKMTGIKEFFQTEDKDGSRLASLLLTNTYCLDAAIKGVGDFAIEDDIKSIWGDMASEPSYFPALILNHITGFRKNQMITCFCEDICYDLMATIKTDGKGRKWLEADHVCRMASNISEDSEQYCMWLSAYEFEKMTLKNTYEECDIFTEDIIQELTYPFMKGFIFMLAVYGLVEIAYNKEPDKDATCFYDTLKYIRLTPLGEYALELTRKYEQPKNDTHTKIFELYEDSLMVKSLTDTNPFESVLNNMGTAISKKLYKISYESFLDGCTSKSDITNKINLFRDYICKEPPANWEQFFKELENRCKPMKAPQKKYTLLQIPAGNKELQRIILTDPTIRKYSLKAEGFILLVETNNKGKVVEALKKYGYLI